MSAEMTVTKCQANDVSQIDTTATV